MPTPRVELPEFLRIFAIQDKARLMLFLGAGASALAGIPTATDMTWMFKRDIYCSETGVSLEALKDLSVDRNQRRLQDYFDAKGGFPPNGADNEYSIYFEKALPDSGYRRNFIRRILQPGRPTLGHECLAVLLAQGHCDWVWTTNFDDLVERAERTDAPRRLAQVGPESRTRIETIIADDLRPVLVKLHGDYRYDKLQNTDNEIRELDADLRRTLVQMSQDQGLVMIGYSGRDESIMSTLEEAAQAGGFKHGLYWCVREGGRANVRVQALVERVVQQNGRGGFVEIPSFDELLVRLYRQCGLHDPEIERKAEALFEQRRPFTLTTREQFTNPLKVNAIKVIEYPTSPYKFQTSIQDWKELRETIKEQPIVAGLLGGHVIAFGNRERTRTAFGSKMTGPIEVTDIKPNDLRRTDSVMMGLFYDMIGQSLVRKYGLRKVGRNLFYLPDPRRQGNSREFAFRHGATDYTVSVATNSGRYVLNEGFSFQLDFHEDIIWFVLEPTIVVTSDGSDLATVDQRRDLTNRELSRRYNPKVHEMLLFWIYYLSSISNPISFVFPPTDESGVRIVLDTHYAYSSKLDG